MKLHFVPQVLSLVAVLALVGGGCAGSTATPSASIEGEASTSTISVSSPKAGSTVGETYQISGQAPAGEPVYVAAMVGETFVSLTFTDPDAQGNFSMPAPTMGSVPAGDFTLQFYNLDEDYNWVNTLDVPLKFAP